MGDDEGTGKAEPSVQVPERTLTPGVGSGSCPFHRERLGPEVRGARGHSGALQGPQESFVARVHAAQS